MTEPPIISDSLWRLPRRDLRRNPQDDGTAYHLAVTRFGAFLGATCAAIIVLISRDTVRNFRHALGRVARDLWSIRGELSRDIFGIVPPFMSDPPAIGTIRLENSPHTSVVHNYPLADRMTRDVYVPSLALEAIRMYFKLPRNGEWQRDAFVFSGRRAPIDPDRNFLIRW